MTPRHNRKRLIIEAIAYGALIVIGFMFVMIAVIMYFD